MGKGNRVIFRRFVLIFIFLLLIAGLFLNTNRNYCIFSFFCKFSREDIAVFHNVCILPSQHGHVIVKYYNIQHEQTADEKAIVFSVGVGPNIHNRNWTLQTKKELVLPPYKANSAYFVKFSAPGNFHHFWLDTFIGLYGAMKKNDELYSDKHVYFNGSCKGDSKCAAARFQLFITGGLNVSLYTAYQDVTEPTCYKKAIFGYTVKNVALREVEKHVIKNLLSDVHCPENQVIVQTRRYRRITNPNKVVEDLKAHDVNVKAVDFEAISVLEQLSLMACSKVLVGVQGAGMEWFRFMLPPAGVIEIGWQHWPPFYMKTTIKEGYVTFTIPNCKAIISNHSLDAYAKANRLNNISRSDTSYINKLVEESTKVRFYMPANIWKYADCEVPVQDLLSKVKDVLHTITASSHY